MMSVRPVPALTPGEPRISGSRAFTTCRGLENGIPFPPGPASLRNEPMSAGSGER